MKALPMMRLIPAAFLTMATLLSGCASMSGVAGNETAAAPQHTGSAAKNATRVQDDTGSVVIQQVEYRSGVSSATVERLARRFGCEGTNGAGLITEKGVVEVYRMRCENGTTFLAQCELRQCRPMR